MRAIEASRQQRGGLEAYRRRVVAASTDAERYRGYAETSTPRDGGRGEGAEEGTGGGPRLRLLRGDDDGDGSIPSGSSASFNDREGSGGGAGLSQGESRVTSEGSLSTSRESTGDDSSTAPSAAAAGKGGGGVADEGATAVWLGEESAAAEGPAAALASGGGGFAEGGHAPTAARRGRGGDGGDGGGGRGSFVDVVPFNNIRAKYLRPWDDTELSGPYHVVPSPDWGAGGAAGSRSRGSSMGGPSIPTSTNRAMINAAGSGRTMEAYHRTAKQGDPVTHQRSKTLNWKERREWGAR